MSEFNADAMLRCCALGVGIRFTYMAEEVLNASHSHICSPQVPSRSLSTSGLTFTAIELALD